MAMVLAKVNVAYSDELIEILQRTDRSQYGGLEVNSGQDDAIQNHIYIFFKWNTITQAKQYWESDAGKTEVLSWRSVTAPVFVYIRDRRDG